MRNSIIPHGSAPFAAAVIHGGPGAKGGSAAELARDLNFALQQGVLELRQTKLHIAELIDECAGQLKETCSAPIVLIGHSWGAWLAVMTAVKYPKLVSRVIAVGTPPLRSGIDVDARRKANFSEAQLRWYQQAIDLKDWAWLGRICEVADSFAQGEEFGELAADFDGVQYESIWSEAVKMRDSGEIERIFAALKTPLTLIHGDCDPHPGDCVRQILKEHHVEFEDCPLSRCGHTPWRERYARAPFFTILKCCTPASCQSPEISGSSTVYDTNPQKN